MSGAAPYERSTQGSAQLAAGDAVRLARDAFAQMAVTEEVLHGEADRNVLVETDDARRYVLKVARAGASRAELDFEVRLLEHLAGKELPFGVPRALPTVTGEYVAATSFGGREHLARLLTWVPGTLLSSLPWHRPELLREVGATAARLTEALSDFDDPAAARTHHWDMRRAPEAVRECVGFVDDAARRGAIDRIVGWFDEYVTPKLDGLPTGIVHQDLNDFNVLVTHAPDGTAHVSGVIDPSDALHTVQVAELAIAVAYAMLRKPDPLAAACEVVRGFDDVRPLSDDELAVVFPLAAVRLCANATTWSRRQAEDGANEYGRARMRHTFPVIEHLALIEPRVAEARLRHACGRVAVGAASRVAAWLATANTAPLLGDAPVSYVDLSPASERWDGPDEPAALGSAGAVYAGYDEARFGDAAPRGEGAVEPATISLGVDVFCPAGTTIHAPFAGMVETRDGDGLVLRHATGDGVTFWTHVRGLAPSAVAALAAGDTLGTATAALHVQVLCLPTAVPRRVRASEREFWRGVALDPTQLLGVAPHASTALRVDDVLRVREQRIARSQRSYYQRPPNLVRGRGAWFTDEDGLQYLDAVNNVTHVGHCHPHVVAAGVRQMRRLNTNSRFVYEALATYADRLAARLPDPLNVLFFVCTGSEANDLALRMARTTTQREDVYVLDAAYHGNTIAVTGISPNRYDGPGGTGAPATTHAFAQPDRYRGAYGYDDARAGEHYAADAVAVVDRLVAANRPPAAFFAESLMGTAGQVVLPDGYLAAVFAAVRAAGGLCVSDEVQVGFGRLGTNFWGFEDHGVVPDIVTMGKPMGNGHPIAAVATTREIADAFDNGMRYFNTFAGNPVSCAIAHAVLDVLDDEDLQHNAEVVGSHFVARLTALQDRHELVGDVRGKGLYAGVELVTSRATKEPATRQAYLISERMMRLGVITYPNARFDNVLKFKPPMMFTLDDADRVVDTLDRVLTEGW
ncbi:MAG TPA: aminotransferase class III-fold pyridoxal phosphate-dependent enzyme [Acidimicrobiales bacterium]|nr:aminotransferase class III-fold pyridoxal phosphate-dependent enzyme [Acidimicrobiales bacterium]